MTAPTHHKQQGLSWIASSGPGPTVLLLHGNSMSAQAFAPLFEEPFASQHHLVALDFPGHGASDFVHERCNPAGFVAAAQELLAHLKPSSVVLVGWSLGGHVALALAPHVEKLRGLMLFGTPPLYPSPTITAEAFQPNPLVPMFFQEQLSDEQVHALAQLAGGSKSSMLEPMMRAADPRVRSGIAAALASGTLPNERAIAQTLSVPIAVLHGENDPLIRGEFVRATPFNNLWRGAVQMLPDCGHAPQLEQPERFRTLLGDFLRDLH